MRSILVTRPQPVADEFAEKLRRGGFAVYVAPMTEYVEMAADLSALSSCQAIIFTSAQAVRVFAAKSFDRRLPVLAVGDATALTAEKAGFTKVYSAAGDSDDVAALVRSKAVSLNLKKIFHPCSEDTGDEIGRAVAAQGIEVVRCPVYRAQFLERLPDEVSRALQEGRIDTITLFSARTAENLVRLMQQSKELRGISARLEVVCLSERIAQALRSIPWRSIRVARQPRMTAMLEALQQAEAVSEDRRASPSDRRQRQAVRNELGYIISTGYSGPDRRGGVDRRAHQKRQRELVHQEKMKFINRTALTFSFIFIAVVLVGVFLMAPEYAQIERGDMKIPSATDIGERLHRVAQNITSSTATAVQNGDPREFMNLLDNVTSLSETPAGEAAVGRAVETVRRLLARSPDDPDTISAAIELARTHDKTLDSLLHAVHAKNIAAAALLLTLNEFRSNVSHNRPYADDLALLQKFVGSDPEMNEALKNLAPYAEKGATSREALQDEFNGLVADIVMAKIQGRDVSVEQQALRHFHNLVQKSSLDDLKGDAPDIVAARAQLRLNQGDVEGAMREMQALQGPGSASLQPWMKDARNYMAAEKSTDTLTQGILSALSQDTGISVEDLFTQMKDTLGAHPGYAGVMP